MTRLTRSRRLSSAYSLMDELMASAVNPMPDSMLNYQLTRIYQGLHALETAEVPTIDDWQVVTDAYNMLETLVLEMKVCEDTSGLLQDASQALYQAGVRHLNGGNIRLDGKGIEAVRAVIQDYAEVVKLVPHRALIKCHRLTEKRVAEIRRGVKQSEAHKVVEL